MDEFVKVSQYFGNKLLFVQGAGGNTSIKIRNKLYIKASGIPLKGMSETYGYACCLYKPIAEFFIYKKKYYYKDELHFLQFVASQIVQKETYGAPSMETGFHAVIPSKYVFHLHSVYANVLGCMKDGSQIVKKLCKNIPHLIIDYTNPGYELAFLLAKRKSIPQLIFLRNHGIILHGQNTKNILKLATWLHETIEVYLKQERVFVPFHISKNLTGIHKYVFPDSAVFSNVDFSAMPQHKRDELVEIFSANNYIVEIIRKLKKEPIFLNRQEINKLLNMQQEKHRLKIFNH